MSRRYVTCLLAIVLVLTPWLARAEAEVGRVLPPFDTTLLDGKTVVHGKDLRGKVVLAMFWATWCPYCRKEMPAIEAMHVKYRQQGLQVLALSLDADAFSVETYIKDNDFTLPVAMRAKVQEDAFGRISATPTTVLIDRNGVVRMRHTGMINRERLESRLSDLLTAK